MEANVPPIGTHMPQGGRYDTAALVRGYVRLTCRQKKFTGPFAGPGRQTRPGKKIFSSRSADSSESEAWIRFSRTMTP